MVSNLVSKLYSLSVLALSGLGYREEEGGGGETGSEQGQHLKCRDVVQ